MISDAYRQVKETKDNPLARDVAMVGARIALAWVFVYHGGRTLFGWFGGPGIHRGSIFYGQIAGLHPATFFTVLGGSIELFGAIAVGLGVFGRLGAAAITGDMIAAMVTVTFGNGMASSAPGGGYELNLGLAGLAFVVAVLGTGRLSLDVVLGSMRDRTAKPARAGRVRYDDRPGHIPAS
jgi:putative oxidoreductase